MYVCLNVNISKTVGDTSKVTINDYLGERILLAISQYGSCMGPMHRAYALSIRIKIDDLGWPWPATSSNSLRILRDFADLGANNGKTNKDRPILSATEL